jgi:hypothetical protein
MRRRHQASRQSLPPRLALSKFRIAVRSGANKSGGKASIEAIVRDLAIPMRRVAGAGMIAALAIGGRVVA